MKHLILLLTLFSTNTLAQSEADKLRFAFSVGECNTILELFNGAMQINSSDVRQFVRSYLDAKSASYNMSTQDYLNNCNMLIEKVSKKEKQYD